MGLTKIAEPSENVFGIFGISYCCLPEIIQPYVAVAAKIPNLKDSRHSESASDLQQCLYPIV